MQPRLARLVIASLLTLPSLGACGESAIQDKPSGELDKSSASWEEPGAVPDLPLDSGPPELDAATDAGTPDAAVEAGAGGDAGAPAGDAGSGSDAAADDAATGEPSDAGDADAGDAG